MATVKNIQYGKYGNAGENMNEDKRCLILNKQQHRALMEILQRADYAQRIFTGIPIEWEELPLAFNEDEYTSKW
jgi:hypothetical protein